MEYTNGLGAAHGADIGPTFGTGQDAESICPKEKVGMDAMQDAWIAFARNGNPSTDAVPWPAMDDELKPMLITKDGIVSGPSFVPEAKIWATVDREVIGKIGASNMGAEGYFNKGDEPQIDASDDAVVPRV